MAKGPARELSPHGPPPEPRASAATAQALSPVQFVPTLCSPHMKPLPQTNEFPATASGCKGGSSSESAGEEITPGRAEGRLEAVGVGAVPEGAANQNVAVRPNEIVTATVRVRAGREPFDPRRERGGVRSQGEATPEGGDPSGRGEGAVRAVHWFLLVSSELNEWRDFGLRRAERSAGQ